MEKARTLNLDEEKIKKIAILSIEDNDINQLVLEMVLEDLGIENITTVENGLQGLEEYKKNYSKYDLILMDINMPIMNGIESTMKIIEFEKENNIPHTPISAITANIANIGETECLDVGMDDYIAKPIAGNSIVDVLEKFLNFKA